LLQRVGIGLNSAVCAVGNFGSAQRFSYSAIGDGMNLASRVESLTKQYKVPILVIICNNQGYVSQEWNLYKYFPSGHALRENNPYGRVIEPTPDYAAMAPAFGAHGECVNQPAQLEAALGRAITAVQAGRLALLDVRLEP